LTCRRSRSSAGGRRRRTRSRACRGCQRGDRWRGRGGSRAPGASGPKGPGRASACRCRTSQGFRAAAAVGIGKAAGKASIPVPSKDVMVEACGGAAMAENLAATGVGSIRAEEAAGSSKMSTGSSGGLGVNC